jgi:RNA-binding protein NOB1
MNWAAIAKTEPQKGGDSTQGTCMAEQQRPVAVIDANAIIQRDGLLNLKQCYDRIVTIPQVLREIRDGESRRALAALPFDIETQEPTEDSMQAVVAFARSTGDLHALSAVDMGLIALARSIEVEYYGSSHLRTRPAPPKALKKPVVDEKHLPGWGVSGGSWSEIDRINEEEEAAALALIQGEVDCVGEDPSSGSHVAAEVQQLNLSAAATDESDESGNDGEDEQWETAYKNRGKARRMKKKERRRQELLLEQEMLVSSESEEIAHGNQEYACTTEEEDVVADHPAGQSNVISMTADFAMQNVILQMGLRLAAPDGRQIDSVTRWVLRCTACQQVTKEVGRLFCPRCGNATLDKVKVTISPDGAEQYGIRKKHILRGTKYSLPKPKGGRNHDPILREDQLLTKKHLLRSKKASKAAELDPFAPEYTDETWHQVAAVAAGPASMATLLNSGWKKNPNERKHVATNRRRK